MFISDTSRLEFSSEFLKEVADYHVAVQRPPGTFSLNENILKESPQNELNNDIGENENKNLIQNKITNQNQNQKDTNSEIIGSNSCMKIDDMKLLLSQMSIQNYGETDFHGSKNEIQRGSENDKQEEGKEDREIRKEEEMASYLLLLSAVDREICHLCGGRRQIYCGDCGGIRLDRAESLLPQRVVLPFDVLLDISH